MCSTAQTVPGLLIYATTLNEIFRRGHHDRPENSTLCGTYLRARRAITAQGRGAGFRRGAASRGRHPDSQTHPDRQGRHEAADVVTRRLHGYAAHIGKGEDHPYTSPARIVGDHFLYGNELTKDLAGFKNHKFNTKSLYKLFIVK
jgi:hypothetical protein